MRPSPCMWPTRRSWLPPRRVTMLRQVAGFCGPCFLLSKRTKCAHCWPEHSQADSGLTSTHEVAGQVHTTLAAGADAAYQEPAHGRSALMAAAEAGHEQVRGTNNSFVSTLTSWPWYRTLQCNTPLLPIMLANCCGMRRP